MNPIIQMLNSAGNISRAMEMANKLKSGNVNEVFNQMVQNNPQFRKFVEDNKGKTAEQIAKENNIDLSVLNQFMR